MTRRYFDDDLYRYDEDRWVASDLYIFFPPDMNSLGRKVHKCSNRHFEWFRFIGIPYRRLSTVYTSDSHRRRGENAPFGNLLVVRLSNGIPSCRRCSFFLLIKIIIAIKWKPCASTDLSMILLFNYYCFFSIERFPFDWLFSIHSTNILGCEGTTKWSSGDMKVIERI